MSGQRLQNFFFPAAVFIYAVAMAARLISALDLSFWSDELTSLFFARGPLRALLWDNSPPLFNFLLHFWPGRPVEEFTFRILPFIFFALTPWLLFFTARRHFGALSAALALAFASLHGTSFYYAVELRPYSLFAMASALNLWFYLRVAERRKVDAMYVFSILLLASTHYFAAIPLVAQFVCLLFILPKRPVLAFSTAAVIAVFIYLPLSRVRTDALHHLAFSPQWLAFTFPYAALQGLYSRTFAVIMIAAIAFSWKYMKSLPWLISLSLAATVPIAWFTGLYPAQPIHMIFLAPYLILTMAVFVARLKYRWLATAVAVHFIALNLWIIRADWGRDHGGWKSAAGTIPAAPETLVIPLATTAVKRPYFVAHHTYFPPPEEQITDFKTEAAAAHEIWLLFPDTRQGVDKAAQQLQEILPEGFEEKGQGVFSPQASHPIRYYRLQRAP